MDYVTQFILEIGLGPAQDVTFFYTRSHLCAHSFVAIELLTFCKNAKNIFYCSRELSVFCMFKCGFPRHNLCSH